MFIGILLLIIQHCTIEAIWREKGEQSVRTWSYTSRSETCSSPSKDPSIKRFYWKSCDKYRTKPTADLNSAVGRNHSVDWTFRKRIERSVRPPHEVRLQQIASKTLTMRPPHEVVYIAIIVSSRIKYFNIYRPSCYSTFVEPLFVVGNLSVHLERPADAPSVLIVDLLTDSGLSCRVITAPTHDLGSLLDMPIVASRDDLPPPSVEVADVGLPDHRLVRS